MMTPPNTIAALQRETKVPVVVVNHRGAILWINTAFEALFGWSRQDIIGRPLTTIIPRTMHEVHQLGFSRFLATGVPTLLNRPITLKAVTKDGTIFDAEHTIMAERQGNEWLFAATIKAVKSGDMKPGES